MAATTGLRLPASSSRCIACWPPRASADASAADLRRESISMSAPATKLSGFADASTIALTALSSASLPKVASNSP